MTWFAVGSAVVSAASTAYSAYSASKNKAQPLDVSKAISDAQTQATNDLQNSINLENQYLPGQAQNRADSWNLTNQIASGSTPLQQMQLSGLQQGSGVTAASTGAMLNNPLTAASLNSILQSLNMGGQLDPSTQAQVAQSALQGAGTAGISGSGAGRGLVARDLGLTSLQLLQSRQNQASAAGNAYGALGLQQQGLQLQSYLGQLGLIGQATGQQQQYSLGLGSLMANTPLPNSGLSPSQVASLDVGNTNIINGANQQQAANNATTASAAGGLFSSLLGNSGVQSGLASLFGGGGGATAAAAGGTGTSAADALAGIEAFAG